MTASTHPAAQSWIRLRDALAAAAGLPTELASPLERAEAEAFKEVTGYPLHPDLRAVYEVNNGVTEDWPRGMFLFGGRFLPCRQAAVEQASFQEVAAEGDWENDPASDPRVKYDYPAPQLTPFWIDGNGNSVAIDNEPGPEGTSGQICSFGADLEGVEVLFPSLAALFDFLYEEVRAGHFVLSRPDQYVKSPYPQLIESARTRGIVHVIGGAPGELESVRAAQQTARCADEWVMGLCLRRSGLTAQQAHAAVQEHIQSLRGTLERDRLARTNLSGLAAYTEPEQALRQMETALLAAVDRRYSSSSAADGPNS